MSLLAVTVGSDPSAVVNDVRAVGWYGVNVYHRLACSGGCYDALSSVDAVDACCGTCGLRPVVEVSLYAQPGMIDSDVSACVEEGDVLVFEGDPRVPPVLFAVSRPMWEGVLASARGWREFVVAAGAFVEIGARRFFKIGDPDVWVTRDGEHLTREEFARVVQNTTTPVIVNPAEVRWYERPVDE